MKTFLTLFFLLTWASVASAFSVTLSWTDNSSNEDGFKIQAASTCAGAFVDIATVGTNVTTFTDPNATSGKCYRVYAFNVAGNSGFSNTAAAPTLPSDPTNLILK